MVVALQMKSPAFPFYLGLETQEGNVFTHVCHSVHGGGVVPYPAGTRPPWDQTPPRTRPPGTTKAGSTHPTRMLSWYFMR